MKQHDNIIKKMKKLSGRKRIIVKVPDGMSRQKFVNQLQSKWRTEKKRGNIELKKHRTFSIRKWSDDEVIIKQIDKDISCLYY